jgi:hypothetical protein
LIAAMRDQRVTALDAHGLMTDAVLPRIAALDHITALDLEGSRELTDEGLRHLHRMPQLQRLNVSGAKITDRGLEVLRHLEDLRRFQMTWQRGVTDAGVANLKFCDGSSTSISWDRQPATAPSKLCRERRIFITSTAVNWSPTPGCDCSTIFR